MALAALGDGSVLEAGGYAVSWLRQLPQIYTAAVCRDGDGTRLEWVVDSDYRFFPTVRDEVFGYVLHPVDLALNKAMAAAGRREVRDIVDLVTVHKRILGVGAVIWVTPEGLIAEIRRNANYPLSEWPKLLSQEPVDPVAVPARLREALREAEDFVAKMPTRLAGLLFLREGRVVQPDALRIEEYQTHAGRRRGQWPESVEISGAMLRNYGL